ncbi:MAG: hypothetical protein FWD34_09390 [Oscillospiraceae bacterium]|nr:hypothetical protein [Oscillospiraceae bacterium]
MKYICPNNHITRAPQLSMNLLTNDPFAIYDPFYYCPYCGDYPLKEYIKEEENTYED